jgi:hypothetical protein
MKQGDRVWSLQIAQEPRPRVLVVAPSLVPKKADDRVKTNQRDAVSPAKLLRADELGAGRAP